MVDRCISCALSLSLIVALSSSVAFARAPKKRRAKPAVEPTQVELFDGIKQGVLKVRVVPTNEFESKVRITNTTPNPVSIKIPKAVAAVHVLKQFAPPGGNNGNFGNLDPNNLLGNGNGNGNNTGNGNGQPVGGGFGVGNGYGNGQFGQQNGFQNGALQQGFFSIPAKRTRELRLSTVCLKYGKPTPKARFRYELRPVEDVVSDPALRKLLADYNPAKTDRMTMQAAAWHLANGLSWRTLQGKTRRHIGFRPTRLFNRRQLMRAYRLVESAQKSVKTDKTANTEPTKTVRARLR